MNEHILTGLGLRISGVRPLWRLALASLLGAMAAFGQAPWDLWPLTLLALCALFGLYRQATGPWAALMIGWAAGTGYFILALSWIVEPFMVDIARHGWMAPFALLGLSAGMGLYWALSFGLARLSGGGSLALIAIFTLAEAARGLFFTGFAWAQIGHVWIDTPFLQAATLGGALGLSAAVLGLSVALWHLLAGRRLSGGVALVSIPAICVLAPQFVAQSAPPASGKVVRLIQPNAAQHEKWDRDMIPVFFNRQLAFSAEGENRPDLIVWPETAVPVLLDDGASTFATIADAARGAPVVVGLQRLDGPRLYNTLAVIGAQGQVMDVYDKHHLVPFGEFIPFGDWFARFGIKGLAAQDGNGYSAGRGAQVIDLGASGKALPLICYEGVFARNILSASERPDFLLLITNDAWFGKVSGPYQHLAQARLRSAEQGLPMVRVANTGISAMIDANGRVVAHLPLGEAGWIDAALPPAHPPTPYARIGDGPVIAALFVLLGLGIALRRRRP